MIPRPIRNDAESAIVYDLLTKQNRPLPLLKTFMSLFDAYRQHRKMGWSRPWNKVGMNVFSTYRLIQPDDQSLFALSHAALKSCWTNASTDLFEFVDTFFKDNKVKGYIFFHDRSESSTEPLAQEGSVRTWEGVTLSFGRPASVNAGAYDRLDVIIENEIVHNRVREDSQRITFVVDPYAHAHIQTPYCVHTLGEEDVQPALLFQQVQRLILLCCEEASDRAWQHWSHNLIHTFGPRKRSPEGSLFTKNIVDLKHHLGSIAAGSEQSL